MTGRVRVGLRADLLLVEGDPSRDISALQDRRGAMIGGHWYPQPDLDSALQGRVEYYADEDRFMGVLENDGVDAARAWIGQRPAGRDAPFRDSRVNMYIYQLAGADKDFEKALATAGLVIEFHPTSWYAYDTLAFAHEQAGDVAAAIAAYERSLEIYPGNFSAVESIARLKSQ